MLRKLASRFTNDFETPHNSFDCLFVCREAFPCLPGREFPYISDRLHYIIQLVQNNPFFRHTCSRFNSSRAIRIDGVIRGASTMNIEYLPFDFHGTLKRYPDYCHKGIWSFFKPFFWYSDRFEGFFDIRVVVIWLYPVLIWVCDSQKKKIGCFSLLIGPDTLLWIF